MKGKFHLFFGKYCRLSDIDFEFHMTTVDRKMLFFKKYKLWSTFVSLKYFFASSQAALKKVFTKNRCDGVLFKKMLQVTASKLFDIKKKENSFSDEEKYGNE